MPKINKYRFRYVLLGIFLLVALSVPSLWITPGMAVVTFKPPGAQAPGRSSGGASRDGSNCGFANVASAGAVTPLMPKTNIGFTVVERPTIFVYVPKTSAKKAYFSLQDQDTNLHYQTTIKLPNNQGVVEIKLPNSADALSYNKNYKWSLAMVCSEDLEPDSPWVSGWIRRVEPNRSLAKYQSTASLELVSLLAVEGIWYDSLSTLAQLRRAQPDNQALTTSWQQLLKAVGLEEIATAQLVN